MEEDVYWKITIIIIFEMKNRKVMKKQKWECISKI